MLFAEEDAPLLKAWIVKRIENTSDADSDVLAEYVIALLKHDGDLASVRKLCEEEIPDFLTEDPKPFLDDVFQAIAHKSYLPGGRQPPKPAAPEPTAPSSAPSNEYQAYDDYAASPPRPNPRKRGYYDLDNPENQDSYYSGYGGRAMKQPRRGGRRGRGGDARGGRHRSPTGASDFPMPPFGPFNGLPMDVLMQMQAMGLPFPDMVGGRGPPRRRGRCHDFDTKGYCSRGSTCQYDHGNGNDSFYVPPSRNQDEYDPSNATLPMGGQPDFAQYLQAMNAFASGSGQGRGRGGRRERVSRKKGGARAPFSADGPVNDRSKSTIVVENIPEESFSEEHVRDFFSQFGNIVEIQMQPYKHLAIVKYDDWTAANAAYRSPKVIFDNRFVKVFWHKDVTENQASSAHQAGANFNGGSEQDQEPEPELDLEEFQRRQEEAQKQHQEREAKREAIERQRQELEKQQEELLARHRQETERLQAKLAEKNGGDAGTATSGTDMLRAKLAALEQEAKLLGIDPDAAEDFGGYPPSGAGYRGRGGWRGRGTYAPRARGRGGLMRGQDSRHAAYAQYSLDNRPKKLAITGVDFTTPEKDEVLRHFLLNLGEFESVDPSPSITHVSFRDRRTAERFFYALHDKELPGVDGKLHLEWAKQEPGAKPSASGAGGETVAAGGGDAVGDDVMGEMDEDHEQQQQQQQQQPQRQDRQVDMDYDVGDQDDWGE